MRGWLYARILTGVLRGNACRSRRSTRLRSQLLGWLSSGPATTTLLLSHHALSRGIGSRPPLPGHRTARQRASGTFLHTLWCGSSGDEMYAFQRTHTTPYHRSANYSCLHPSIAVIHVAIVLAKKMAVQKGTRHCPSLSGWHGMRAACPPSLRLPTLESPDSLLSPRVVVACDTGFAGVFDWL